MKEFDDLVRLADKLIGPEGCPWDKQQTFTTLQPYLVEETHEVLEAVDKDDPNQMIEELGDLLYVIIFYARIAEKEGKFTIREILKRLHEKMVRRHPHVFGNVKAETIEDVMSTWENVKKHDNKLQGRKSILDGIPKTLPLLIQAQKILQRLDRSKFPELPPEKENDMNISEQLLQLVISAMRQNIDLESVLRKQLGEIVERFKEWEQQ